MNFVVPILVASERSFVAMETMIVGTPVTNMIVQRSGEAVVQENFSKYIFNYSKVGTGRKKQQQHNMEYFSFSYKL